MLSRLSTKLGQAGIWHKFSAYRAEIQRGNVQGAGDQHVHWHEFIEISTDWLWESDLEHRWAWLSPGATRQTTHSVQLGRLQQQRLLDTAIAELSPEYWDSMAKALAARQSFRNALLCLKNDHNLHWVYLSGKPRFSEQGEFQGYIGCASELEHRQAFGPIADLVADSVLGSNPLDYGIALFDSETRLLAWNRSFAALHSYLGEQLALGLNVRQWLAQQQAQNLLNIADLALEEWLDKRCDELFQPTSEIVHLNGLGWRKCDRLMRQGGGFVWLETPLAPPSTALQRPANVLAQVPAKETLAVLVADSAKLIIQDANAAALALYNCSLDDLLGSNVLDLFAQTDEGISFIGRALAQGSGYTSWVLHRTKHNGNDAVAVEMSISELSSASGMCMTIRPIAAARAENRTILLERLQDFTEIAVDVAWELDSEFRVVYASKHLLDMLGKTAASLIGLDFVQSLQAIISDPSALQAYQHKLFSRETVTMELPLQPPNAITRVYRMTAKPILGAEGEFKGYRGVGQDITDSFQSSQQLIYQATHDDLTGLINRREFEHRLASARELAKTSEIEHVLCYLDLDRFKIVNDTVGHSAGDQLLRQVADILSSRVRRHDTIARLGGDEFGLLLDGCGIADACRVAQKLIDNIKEFKFSWQAHQFEIGVSIGMVPINRSSSTVSHLLSLADIACYAAKDGGRNRYHVYQAEDQGLLHRQADLRSAVSLTP